MGLLDAMRAKQIHINMKNMDQKMLNQINANMKIQLNNNNMQSQQLSIFKQSSLAQINQYFTSQQNAINQQMTGISSVATGGVPTTQYTQLQNQLTQLRNEWEMKKAEINNAWEMANNQVAQSKTDMETYFEQRKEDLKTQLDIDKDLIKQDDEQIKNSSQTMFKNDLN